MTAKRAREVKRIKAFLRKYPYTFKLLRVPVAHVVLYWSQPIPWNDDGVRWTIYGGNT